MKLKIVYEELICHGELFESSDGKGLEARAIVTAIDEEGNHWRAERLLRLRFRKQKIIPAKKK